MAVLLDGQIQARAQMGVNVVCPRHKIVPKRHREGSAILRSPTTRRRERAPMNNQTPRVTRAGTPGNGNAPLKGCIGLLLILNKMHNSATDRRLARLHSKTPPARKPALPTTLSSSLRRESAAEHHTDGQYSKTGRTKLQKISEEATDHEIPDRTFS